jgi:hypothetical protein
MANMRLVLQEIQKQREQGKIASYRLRFLLDGEPFEAGARIEDTEPILVLNFSEPLSIWMHHNVDERDILSRIMWRFHADESPQLPVSVGDLVWPPKL